MLVESRFLTPLLAFFALLMLLPNKSAAQAEEIVLKPQYMKVNILGTGVGVEHKLAKNLTFAWQVRYTWSLALSTQGDQRTLEFITNPGVEGSLRYYPNLERRLNQGKDVRGYAAQYIGLLGSFRMPALSAFINDIESSSSFTGVVIGTQHAFMKRGYIDIKAGPGYYFEPIPNGLNTQFGWYADISLGMQF